MPALSVFLDLDTAVLEAANQLKQQGQDITLRRICDMLGSVPYGDVKASVWRMRNRCTWPATRQRGPKGLILDKHEVEHRIATQPREEFLSRPKPEPNWLPPLGRDQPLETPLAMAMWISGKRWEEDDDQ